MKKIFTLLSLLFFFTGLRSSAQQGEDMQRYNRQVSLSITSFYSNVNLRVSVDGNTYTVNRNKGNDDFVINNLSAGNHSIKIWQVPGRGRGGGMNSQVMRVLYDASVYFRAGYQTDFVLNRFGHVFRDEQPAGSGDYPYPNNPNQYPGYNQAMSNESFNALKSTVTNESFDNSRMNILKQAAAANYFTAAQVRELMQIFSFDNSKLEVAKTFYSRTTDKQNYFMVNDAFSFSGSKDELTKFISQNP